MQKCMGSVVGADCIPRHTCRCWRQKTSSGSTQPSGACQVHMLSPLSALHQVSTAKTKQALTLQCFAADAASAAVAVATTCFWDAIWPHVLVVHPVHACDPVHLLLGLQAAEMAMVLYQHHHLRMTNFIAVWGGNTIRSDSCLTVSDVKSKECHWTSLPHCHITTSQLE